MTRLSKRSFIHLAGWGSLAALTMNICSSVNGVKGQILIDVEWQIFDRSAQKVVETVTTRGTGDVLKFDRNGYDVLWNRAFASSLHALIDQGIIGKYAGVEAKPLPIPEAATAASAATMP